MQVTYASGISPAEFRQVLQSQLFEDFKNAQHPSFTYHAIHVEAVTFFGREPGLIYLSADVSHRGRRIKRAIFLRGKSVGVLLILTLAGEEYVVVTQQPRHAAGLAASMEIPAGVMDEESQYVALKEVREETGIELALNNLSYLGQCYLSPGTCDEKLDLYVAKVRVNKKYLQSLLHKQVPGESDEQITVEVYRYDKFKIMLMSGACLDVKAMAAILLYETKLARGHTFPIGILESEETDESDGATCCPFFCRRITGKA